MKVYIDNAATTKTDKIVLKAMLPYFSTVFGNPMSVHEYGQKAQISIDKARKQIADFLVCSSNEVIFTSGATESNNLAIKGVINTKFNFKPHVIISAIEHHCVLETASWLHKKQLIDLSIVQPQNNGIIQVSDIIKEITSNTVLVSVMYVNNEIGTIQPIAKIGQAIKKINKNIIFHTDATQAINYLNCSVDKLNVDLLSFSGHKIYGPKGIGVLYVRRGTKLSKIQHGGEQEYHYRAGTHNVPGIVGLGVAISLIKTKKHITENKEIKKLRDYLWLQIKKKVPNVIINGSVNHRTVNNLNVSFLNIEGEGILIALDMVGIAVSTGSACSSGALEASHVIMSISNKNHLRSHASIRFSLGKYNTKKDIDYIVKQLPGVVAKLRKISPFKKN